MKKTMNIQQIYGLHAVKAALENKNRVHKELYITQKHRDLISKYHNIVPKIQILESDIFNKRFGNERVTQGIFLFSNYLKMLSLQDFLNLEKNNKNSVILVLDQITDPQNIGAIMRSCILFNCRAIVLGKDNSPELTSSLVKAASGAVEKINYIKVTNLQRSMKELKKNHYWIFGLDSDGKNSKIEKIISNKCVFVLGGEGSGIRNLVKKECDEIITLPFNKQSNLFIDSLNVSNAASIALYEYFKKFNLKD